MTKDKPALAPWWRGHRTGCEVHPDCLTCPRKYCRYESPESIRRLKALDKPPPGGYAYNNSSDGLHTARV